MKKYLVIGNPINHSLSPLLHNYWIKQNNIDAIYEKRLVEEQDLKNLCNEVREGKIQGLNVTVPFKEKIKKYLDYFSDDASDTNAINTIYRHQRNDQIFLKGENTDVYGFMKSCPIQKPRGNALIIGAGGASRAVIRGLCKIGFKGIAITNRTKGNVEKLLDEIKLSPKSKDDIFIYDWCKDEEKVGKPDIVINCTSLGLKKDDKIPLDFLNYKKKFFSKKIYFYDIIYNPEETYFQKNAKKIGQSAINGKMMFIYQAQKSFSIWHNIMPEVNQEVIDLLND